MDPDFIAGYNSYPAAAPFGSSNEFYAGWDAAWEDNQAEQQVNGDYFDYVDQGMYDDDPNPYHGDYSEM